MNIYKSIVMLGGAAVGVILSITAQAQFNCNASICPSVSDLQSWVASAKLSAVKNPNAKSYVVEGCYEKLPNPYNWALLVASIDVKSPDNAISAAKTAVANLNKSLVPSVYETPVPSRGTFCSCLYASETLKVPGIALSVSELTPGTCIPIKSS